MKKSGYWLFGILFLAGCMGKNTPDVSGVKIELKTIRFEKEFFTLDTSRISESLDLLYKKYPGFTADFIYKILGVQQGPQQEEVLKKFISDYRPIMDSVNKVYETTADLEQELKHGLQYVHYYFPQYVYPKTWYTFVGPMDAYFEAGLGGYGDALMQDGMASGLQLHMGSNFSLYQSEMGQALYPTYISRRFTRQTIVSNCLKNIVDELCGMDKKYSVLIDQMVDKGKRLYLLDKFMPEAADTIKIAYTQQQLEGCLENEGRIWNYFVTNNLLLQTDPSIIKDYMGDAPKTQALGDASPGYIGLFVGWQIVRKYMDKFPETSLESLIHMEPRKLYEGSKYRPK